MSGEHFRPPLFLRYRLRMMHWINSHGVEVLIAGWLWAAAVGSMPTLPEGSSFWATWAYGFLHVSAANLKQAATLLNIKLPGDSK